MLTKEQLDTLEANARKVSPGMWLFDAMRGDKLTYILTAKPSIILKMIEELRQAREMRGNFRDKALKVMISQPMQGKSKEEILSVREEAKRYIEDFCGHNVVDTYDESFQEMEGKNTALLSLAKSLERMAECDAVYFCKGWRDARGCRAEFHVAKAYGLETWEEDLHQ